MSNFILMDNYTKEIIAELDDEELSDIVYAADFSDEPQPSEWFSVYYVGSFKPRKVAIYSSGLWYEPDGITELNV